MKIFKKNLLLGLCFIIGNVFSQGVTLKKANAHFEKLEYKDAASLYERVLEKNPKTNIAIHNLSACYLKLNDMPNSEKWYSKSVLLSDVKPEGYLHYAEILKQNYKYEESKKWFAKYNSLAGSDKRGKKQFDSFSHLKELYADSANYKVTFVKGINSQGADFSPYYYKDGLIYISERDHDKHSTSEFMWDQSHFLDLYYSEFNNKVEPSFKKEHPFSSKLNTKYHEGPLAMNKAQTFMVFTRNNYFKKKVHLSDDGVNKLKIFFDEYKDGKWLSAQNFPYNNDQYSCGHPALTSDGKTMYFVSDMPGSIGGTDLWKSKYENNIWSKPENLGDKINTEGNEMFPTLINDSLFYFASNGLIGLGGLDVFTMPYNNGKFGEIKNFGYPINTSNDDFGMIYDPKNESGFFSSNRPNSEGGSDDIYYFKMQGYYLTTLVVDKISLQPLAKSVVTYTNSGKTFSVTTDEKGSCKIKVTPESDYAFTSMYPKYIDARSQISTKDKNAKRNLELVIPMSLMDYKLIATVTDSKTKKIISEVSIKLFDVISDRSVFIDGKTDEQGNVSKMLSGKIKGDKIKFEITLKKEKYLSKTEYFEIVLGDEPIIQIPLKLLEIDEVSVGTDIGKLIDIKPIYFDLDKAIIRSDAAKELDKMVKVMQENPLIVVELGSHTDCRATAKYNLNLSDRRAKASAAYIISKGIDKKRIYGKGYGESKLINNCGCEGSIDSPCSEEEHQLNRRTEFRIVKM